MISANANVLECVVLTEVITDLVNMYESRDFFARQDAESLQIPMENARVTKSCAHQPKNGCRG